MPRKQRIEYPGAVYHVMSRGNYRKELFLNQGTGEAFERCLFEVVERCGWKLHAYGEDEGVKHRISTLTRLLLLK